jgi:cyclopropane fatty-acyl-phospholipid synthase-like methyltransferase
MSFLRKIFFYFWYWRQPPWDTNITPPEVYDFLIQNRPGRALDLGCGTGTNAISLAQQGWQVTGVDFVAKPIRTARKKARQLQVEVDFRVGDVTQLTGIEGPFEFILDIGCYHSLTSKGMEAYRSSVDRLLSPGGSFMLYVFFREADSDSGSGVVEADLEAFSPPLKLTNRQNGFERGTQPSAWLIYTKSEDQEEIL